jgi:Rps23 Pro-64 3,4-dihydroxylase Tpa1-like proline 4-hydroxylase
MLELRLNPMLDPTAFARLYAEKKCVQVPNLFEDDVAAALEKVLLALPWRLICQDEDRKTVLFTMDELKAMSPEARRRLEEGIRQRAAENFGYTYYAYPMIEARTKGWDPNHPIHVLTDFLNSPAFIDFAKAVIGCPGLTKIDAHASNYQRGHYLTRHIDDGAQKERRAAYTIGFSRGWQSDWGGLLLFLEEGGDVIRGFVPRFNVLTVLDGLQLHAVSSVSPFAPVPRLSIAGWFRDDPIWRAPPNPMNRTAS